MAFCLEPCRFRAPAVLAVAYSLLAPFSVSRSAHAAFIRGDSNQDGHVDISDAQFTLNFLFVGGPDPECPSAADTNDDEVIDLSDSIATLDFLFRGGRAPLPPFPAPGTDPTPGLGCGVEALTSLACQPSGPAVVLSWQNHGPYDEILVLRDGGVAATLPGSATNHRDAPPEGGDHAYEVIAVDGGAESDPARCTVRALPDNRAPTLVLLAPAQGSEVAGDSFELRGRVNDDSRIQRLAVDGDDIALPASVVLPHTFAATVVRGPGESGPKLARVEAVDEFGRAVFQELAVGFAPLLRKGAETAGLALDIAGGSGYDELEVIVQPFLSDVPALLDQAVRGVRLYQGSIAGVDITVTGDRVEVTGPIDFDFLPSSANGGRVGLRAAVPRIRFFGRGSSDFGFLGTDNWDATWTGDNVVIVGAVAFTPRADGKGLDVVSDGFIVTIGGSSFSVSGFLDPFGIFDALVNAISGLFEDQIENAVRNAIQDAANNEIVPALAEAFNNLNLDLDLGAVALETSFSDVVESAQGLSILFDGVWRTTAPEAPSYPNYPGSHASFAPFPAFPLGVSSGHAVDATISLSSDTLNQAFAGLVSTGLLVTDLPLSDGGSPIPLNAGTVSSILDRRFLSLSRVDEDDPLGIHVEARYPPRILINEGTPGIAIVAIGADWRYVAGRTEPPPNWKGTSFQDGGWALGPSGFGYSTDPDELHSVRTELAEMEAGEYTSLYIRRTFELADPGTLPGLVLRVLHDDAFVAYVNGVEVGRRNIGTAGTTPPFSALADAAIEPSVAEIDLLAFRSILRPGSNVLAIQGHNAAATSSDFVLAPELIEARPPPAGTISALPAQVLLEDLVVSFVVDADGDGVGDSDADGRADEVSLFSYSVGLRLQTQLILTLGEDGVPTLVFALETRDGPDPDEFPDGIVGGLGGLEIGVADEAFDLDDALLVEFAQLVLAVFGPSLGETLSALELPTLPLPELSFDLNGDGTPDVRLEILRGTFAPVDTTGDGEADWICILADLRSVSG
jgi:hypothetical protein